MTTVGCSVQKTAKLDYRIKVTSNLESNMFLPTIDVSVLNTGEADIKVREKAGIFSGRLLLHVDGKQMFLVKHDLNNIIGSAYNYRSFTIRSNDYFWYHLNLANEFGLEGRVLRGVDEDSMGFVSSSEWTNSIAKASKVEVICLPFIDYPNIQSERTTLISR